MDHEAQFALRVRQQLNLGVRVDARIAARLRAAREQGLATVVVAGAGKVVHPGPTVAALRSLGLPGGRPAVRLLAAAEVGIGLAAVLGGGALPALAVAASYLAFTAVVLRGLTRLLVSPG